MNSQKLVCFILLFSVFGCGSSVVFGAKVTTGAAPLEAVPEGKARVFVGISAKALTDKWLYEWDVKKLKVNWFGNQNNFYAFNILTKEGDTLLPFAKIPNNRKKYPHGHYYFDLEPQELELVAFALNTQNFNTIQGLPGKIKLNLEAGNNYILAYGYGGLEGRVIAPNQIVDVTLTPELHEFCNQFRGQKLTKKARKKATAELYAVGGDNYSKQLACNVVSFDVVSFAQKYEADKKFDRMAKWANKKQSKLQDFVLRKIEHDNKRAENKIKRNQTDS